MDSRNPFLGARPAGKLSLFHLISSGMFSFFLSAFDRMVLATTIDTKLVVNQ